MDVQTLLLVIALAENMRLEDFNWHLSIGKKLMIDDKKKWMLVKQSQNKKRYDNLAVLKVVHGYRCVLYYLKYSQQLPIG